MNLKLKMIGWKIAVLNRNAGTCNKKKELIE